MRKFNELPEMAAESAAFAGPIADSAALKELSAIAMRCGGCGAKVGATVLARALGQITPAERIDVLVGLDAPDDAAIVDTGGPLLSVQTVDYFRAMIDDPYLFGKIAANHALGDLFAMGGTPQPGLAPAPGARRPAGDGRRGRVLPVAAPEHPAASRHPRPRCRRRPSGLSAAVRPADRGRPHRRRAGGARRNLRRRAAARRLCAGRRDR